MACDSCCPDPHDSNNPKFRNVLWIALIANLTMFFVEVVAGVLSDSLSLQADALDFFGDAANYGISLFVAGMALNIRARAALVKSASMALFGCWVIGSAVYRVFTNTLPDPYTMGTIAVLALLVNVAVAALLFQYRSGDSNMRSVWLCSRNDAIGNVAVLIAAAGVLTTVSKWPDLFVATVIAGLSISSAYQVFRLARAEIKSQKQAPHPVTDIGHIGSHEALAARE